MQKKMFGIKHINTGEHWEETYDAIKNLQLYTSSLILLWSAVSTISSGGGVLWVIFLLDVLLKLNLFIHVLRMWEATDKKKSESTEKSWKTIKNWGKKAKWAENNRKRINFGNKKERGNQLKRGTLTSLACMHARKRDIPALTDHVMIVLTSLTTWYHTHWY